MYVDSDLQLWLDTQQHANTAQVTLYAQSSRNTALGYQLNLVRRGPHGQSRIAQGGQRNLVAGEPLALSNLSLKFQADDECHIELMTREGTEAPVMHDFDCPVPSSATKESLDIKR